MKARAGYSEQELPDISNLDNVFCLPNGSVFICDVNDAYTWDSTQHSLTKDILRDDPLEINSSNRIIKVANSHGLFLFIHTSRDPDHNDFENVTTTLYQGKEKIREIPIALQFPILIGNDTLLGISKENQLLAYNLTTATLSKLFQFSQKINGFYEVKNNQFAIVDESNTLGLYQFNKSEFIKLNEVKSIKTVKAIHTLDDDHFVCSVFDNQGNKDIKIKDSQTKLLIFNKATFNCIQEIEIKRVMINKLKQIPDSEFFTDTLIACYRKFIFIINFKDNHVFTLDLTDHIADFDLSNNGKLSVLVTDTNDACKLIEIEPRMLKELYQESAQLTLQSKIEEKKEFSDTVQTTNGHSFFSSPTASISTTQKNQELILSQFSNDESCKETISLMSPEMLERIRLAVEEKQREYKEGMNTYKS
jgi:hypothetical protein